ncbi:MAG: membrane protein insertase YidC [Chloroflexi bacterium]|nr:membrane protein insertase YidC [Chloroflexota bacterium]
MGAIWDLVIMKPLINVLIVLSHYLFGSFGLAIIALTIVINLLMYPLTVKQLRATKSMQALQPKLAELQKKYAKDRARLAQEQMSLYRESGVSPAGCILPMLLQMPVWIALFYSIMKLLGVTPEDFLGLSQYLYSWPIVYTLLPLGNNFLWLNLATGDFVLAILVGGTMWLQQKMTTMSGTDPRQQSMNRMMQWMMPLMFAFLTLQFPSGLALYWVTSNVIRIVMQYFATGWGGLVPSPTGRPAGGKDKKYLKRIAQVEQVPSPPSGGSSVAETGPAPEEVAHGASGGTSQDSRRSYPEGARPIRRGPRRGKGHRDKRR